MASFIKYLNNCRVDKDSEFTHTSLGEPKGRFYISGDKQEEFHRLYADALDGGMNLYMTEKHRDMSPVLIDLDFKQQTSNRIYNDDMIDKLFSVGFEIIERKYYERDNDILVWKDKATSESHLICVTAKKIF